MMVDWPKYRNERAAEIKTVRYWYQSVSGPAQWVSKIIYYTDGFGIVSHRNSLTKGEIYRLGGTREQIEQCIFDGKIRNLGAECEFCGDTPDLGELWDEVIPVCNKCHFRDNAILT